MDDEDGYDDDQMNMMDDLHSQQINVKTFELNPLGSGIGAGSKSMMVAKRPAIGSGIGSGIGGGIGSGIGGGLRKPTQVKPV